MPVILTFGDSNTHGTPPLFDRSEYRRHGPDIRWPMVMQSALGPDWALVEEGLPGRTTNTADPIMGAHMNGQIGLRIALESHGPIDVLTIMLGTNDVKTHFGSTAEAIAGGASGLLGIALSPEMQERHGGFRILLICPPPVTVSGLLAGEFYGGDVKSRALPPLYSALAAHRGVGFLDAGRHIAVSPIDGVHYDSEAHRTFGGVVAAAVRDLLKG